jgi:hypothetical protein
VFTTGVLPPDQEAILQLIVGVRPALQQLGLSVDQAVDLTGSHLPETLAGRALDVNQLGAELAARIAPDIPRDRAMTWQEQGPYAPGQPLGEAVVHFCLRILCLRGIICFGPRAGNQAPFVLVEEWLGHPFPAADPQAARAELLRRFLSCYGPATPAGFAAWLGIRAWDAVPWWRLLSDEITPVDFGGRRWLRTADLAALRAGEPAAGVRLLPPRDPYTQAPDRDTIIENQHHREVWRPVGEPGTLLVRGEIVGTWRARKAGRSLAVAAQLFQPITSSDREMLAAEVDQVAALRAAQTGELQVQDAR